MNNYNLMTLILVNLFFSLIVNGQVANTQIQQIQTSITGQNVQMKQLGDENEALIIQQLDFNQTSNNINITQHGDGNIAQMETKGNHHQTQVAQRGEENIFVGKSTGYGTETFLFQQGAKNKLIQSVDTENQVPIVVIQDGIGNEAEVNLETRSRFSDPIQVIQKGIAPKVIIRN